MAETLHIEEIIDALRRNEKILQEYSNNNTVDPDRLNEILEYLKALLAMIKRTDSTSNIEAGIGVKALRQLKLILALYLYIPDSHALKEEIRAIIRQHSYLDTCAYV